MFRNAVKLATRRPIGLIRYSSSQVKSFFELYPKTFPNGGPPQDLFLINEKTLRRELRGLQSENHPDIVIGSSALSGSDQKETEAKGEQQVSALLNKAYTTLRNPYTRAAYVIQLHHPDHIDITQDDVSKSLIARFQNESSDFAMSYKMLLMTVLEAHESLEMASSEEELESVGEQNEERMKETEGKLESLLQQKPVPWDEVLIEAIRIKYWVNIANGIKEWEPGKPVHLTH